MTQKKGDEGMNASKEIQDEMVGVLTAISIVSKRLASRLIDLDKDQDDENKNEDSERSK
jgi:hypothetical protein